ncbi:MAG: ribokinase [Spirochaetales bacterium]|nr:ribokinase [Spirochaetales bacterium]
MRILNFGSLNIDYVYEVDHFVKPGETLSSLSYSRNTGGKGLNQSVALARAGAEVYHAGKVGDEGVFLKDYLAESGVHVEHIFVTPVPTGHAFIQVEKTGENAIVLYGGANRAVGSQDIDQVLYRFEAGDCLLLQNEISSMEELMEKAYRRGMEIFFNPAPMDEQVLSYPLDKVGWFIVNELEGSILSGAQEPEDIPRAFMAKYPESRLVLTLGSRGAVYADRNTTIEMPACRVRAVDTTAAGDTFIGYFLASLTGGAEVRSALETAVQAAALCVTRPGAADSIPTAAEVAAFLPGRPG